MKKYDDNHFDLAIVDPPYGIGICNTEQMGISKKHKIKKSKGEMMKRRTNKAIILKPVRKGNLNYTLKLKREKKLVKFEALLNKSINYVRGVK